MEQNVTQEMEIGKIRFVLTPTLLGIITLGIYNLVWLYKIHNEMLNHTKDKSISPGKVIGFLFIPIFNFFWFIYLLFYVPGLIKNMDMDDGIPAKKQTNAGLIGIIGLIPFVNLLWAPLIQNALNRHWKRHLPETIEEGKAKRKKTVIIVGILCLALIILGVVLVSVLTPSPPEQSRKCSNNLAGIDGAKDQWALDHDASSIDTPTWDDLINPGKLGYLKSKPVCPMGGTYTIGDMSTPPKCSVGRSNNIYPHELR